ncbi:MAG: hypothetical protein Q4C56_06930 [Peptococcaceae bacterium]|nr:hypothetical protein [Peptococcaceae bacterium]
MNIDPETLIHMPRPASRRHPPMPRHKRSAQFAAFAALGGYERLIARAEAENAARYK